MNRLVKVFGSFCLIAAFLVSCATGPKINEGAIVSLEYTGTFKDSGEQFDSNVGKQPLKIVIGAKQIIPALEKALVGLSEGAKKKISLKAEDAYGQPDEKKIVTLPRDQRFKDVVLTEGELIQTKQKGPDGEPVKLGVKVLKLDDKNVTLDYNHPLAGKDLVFDVKVLTVEPSAGTKQVNIPAKPAAEEKKAEPAHS